MCISRRSKGTHGLEKTTPGQAVELHSLLFYCLVMQGMFLAVVKMHQGMLHLEMLVHQERAEKAGMLLGRDQHHAVVGNRMETRRGYKKR